MQQREPDGLRALHLGHDHDRAAVAAAADHGDLALGRRDLLGAAQVGLSAVRDRSDVAMPPWSITLIVASSVAGSPSMR